MSVTIREYTKRGKKGWEVDINVLLPNGQRWRERRKSPTSSKSGALRWGEAREREVLIAGSPQKKTEVPTLEEFAPRFLDGHARANRQKPGGINHKEIVLRVHLQPALGSKKLDAITNEDVQHLKHRLGDRAQKTVNNVLTVLNTLLKKAVEWNVIERMPCGIRLLKTTSGSFDFYDFGEYDRLVTSAANIDARAHLIVLLGGAAGLRSGEIRALAWTDLNFAKRQICVERSEWRGQVSTTKGNRLRYVPMTNRLADALKKHRHLAGPLVLYRDDATPLTENVVRGFIERAARGAQLRTTGPHMLRHTFCSHLAMRGAPARAIQELAGHKDLATTLRYMHLSEAAVESAIRLLELPAPHPGDILETATT
jgi:integrase